MIRTIRKNKSKDAEGEKLQRFLDEEGRTRIPLTGNSCEGRRGTRLEVAKQTRRCRAIGGRTRIVKKKTRTRHKTIPRKSTLTIGPTNQKVQKRKRKKGSWYQGL